MQWWQPASPLARRLLPQSPAAQKWSGNWMGVSGDKEAYEEWEAGERGDAKDSTGYVGTHAVNAVQMAEMDATQKRVWEVEQREKRSSSTNTHNTHLLAHTHPHIHTLWLYPVIQPNDSNSLLVFHWPFTRVLTHCDSSRPLPACHSGLESIHPLLAETFSTTDSAWLPLPTLSSLSLPFSMQWRDSFIVLYSPAHWSACLLAEQMVSWNL